MWIWVTISVFIGILMVIGLLIEWNYDHSMGFLSDQNYLFCGIIGFICFMIGRYVEHNAVIKTILLNGGINIETNGVVKKYTLKEVIIKQ